MTTNRIPVDAPRRSPVAFATPYKHDPKFWSDVLERSNNGTCSEDWFNFNGCGCFVLVNLVLMLAVGVVGFVLGMQFGG